MGKREEEKAKALAKVAGDDDIKKAGEFDKMKALK
jgi:hypothetical protein